MVLKLILFLRTNLLIECFSIIDNKMKKIRILCFLFATIVGLSPIISGVSAS